MRSKQLGHAELLVVRQEVALNQSSGSLQPLQVGAVGEIVQDSHRSQKPEAASRALPATLLCDKNPTCTP